MGSVGEVPGNWYLYPTSARAGVESAAAVESDIQRLMPTNVDEYPEPDQRYLRAPSGSQRFTDDSLQILWGIILRDRNGAAEGSEEAGSRDRVVAQCHE